LVNPTHFPPIQTNCSPYEEFAAQQPFPARSSAVTSVSPLPADKALQDGGDVQELEQRQDKEAIYA
jgi:hypothetical protein